MNAVNKLKNMSSKEVKGKLLDNAIYIVLGLMILAIIIMEPSFLSFRVFINILSQSSVKLILALGVGGLIVLQGTDLSLGRTTGFAAVISASLLQSVTYSAMFAPNLFLNDMNIFVRMAVALLVVVVVCAIISGINGFIVAKFDIHPFVVTLGASLVVFGLNTFYYGLGPNGGQPLGGLDPTYSAIVNGNIGTDQYFLPYIVIIATVIALAVHFLWEHTVFGKNMFAVGGNPEAAKVSGINVLKVFVLVYLLAGVLYGIAGFLEVARIGSANNATGVSYELDAIAACVIGGISFSGGVGKVKNAVIGVLIFQILSYGMLFVGIGYEWQNIIKGIVIIIAVALDRRKYIKKR